MAQNNASISVTSLRGGICDSEPPITLEDDRCTIAENIEFFSSNLGERRRGCVPVALPTTISSDVNLQEITWLGKHHPTNILGDSELWALAQNLTSGSNLLTRRTPTAWATVNPIDAMTTTLGRGHRLSCASLHGKLFLGHKSAVDQLHVWDGATLRPVGLRAPVGAPTASNTGSGTFSGTRFYRVREVALSGATVLLRSEPSAVLTQSPSGTGTGLVVTKTATANTNATHWELEASSDNANFYRIARIIIGTTTSTDSAPYIGGYANIGVLSEDLTAYTLVPSGKFLTIDADRLVIGGSWENPAYGSRIWWTPVFGSTGNGNDERLDMTVNPYVDLDGFEGGELTALSRAVNGYLYAFKWSHIYKVVRTGNRASAYSAIPLTKARGALPGSLVAAVDQAGYPAQYFLDPVVGPMRIGSAGLEWCGGDIRNLWSRVNLTATVPCHGVFYHLKNQVHFWLALDGADTPNAKIVLHTDEMHSTPQGATRGWVTVPIGNRIANAHCSLMFSDNIDSTSPRNQTEVPFIGKEQFNVNSSTIKSILMRCDTETTDGLVSGDDTDAYYYGKIQSKPFAPTSLLNKHGVMAGTLVAEKVDNPVNDVYVEATKDFGIETRIVNTSLAPSTGGTEGVVIKALDNFSFGDLTTLQLTFGDLEPRILPQEDWSLHAFIAKIRPEQTS